MYIVILNCNFFNYLQIVFKFSRKARVFNLRTVTEINFWGNEAENPRLISSLVRSARKLPRSKMRLRICSSCHNRVSISFRPCESIAHRRALNVN